MAGYTLLDSLVASGARICCGRVEEALEGGVVHVTVEDDEVARRVCELLETSGGPALRLAPNDRVLVWIAVGPEAQGVVIGRIGAGAAVRAAAPESRPGDVADDLVIEAGRNLTLRCGDGSITIREDGKILIKGKDLVSHAQRLNRIKGGAVQIN
jgi:hypothetical protein